MAGVRLESIVKRRYRDRVVGDGDCLIWCGCHLMTDDFVVQAQLMWSSFLALRMWWRFAIRMHSLSHKSLSLLLHRKWLIVFFSLHFYDFEVDRHGNKCGCTMGNGEIFLHLEYMDTWAGFGSIFSCPHSMDIQWLDNNANLYWDYSDVFIVEFLRSAAAERLVCKWL